MIKSRKTIICILCLLTSMPYVYSQNEIATTISADRPGMATGTDIQPFKTVQWETGFGYECNSRSQFKNQTFTLNTSLFRFGVSESAELRLQLDGLGTQNNPDSSMNYGLAPVILGTKIKIFEGDTWIPTVSFMANLTLPIGSNDFIPSFAAPSFYLLFNNPVTDWFSIGYNIGAEWDGETAQPNTFAALCLGFEITDNFGAFVESYNHFMSNELPESYFDFGINWTISPRVQLDLSAAFNLNDISKYANIGLGFAWLIN